MHISTKSSTFVPGLGIVLAVTIKHYESMEKLTVCSIKYGESIYKVNELVDEAGNVHGYRVMRGRCIAKGGNFFNTEREAVGFALRIAFVDVSQLCLGGVL